MCTMDYPKFIVSNQKEESISIPWVTSRMLCILIDFTTKMIKYDLDAPFTHLRDHRFAISKSYFTFVTEDCFYFSLQCKT